MLGKVLGCSAMVLVLAYSVSVVASYVRWKHRKAAREVKPPIKTRCKVVYPDGHEEQR